MASGSTAPLHSANFFGNSDPVMDRDMHERRLALALDVDTSIRMISPSPVRSSSCSPNNSSDHEHNISRKLVWKDNQWIKLSSTSGLFRFKHYLSLNANFDSTNYSPDTEKGSSHYSIQISINWIIKACFLTIHHSP
jgi:hypothetical protein